MTARKIEHFCQRLFPGGPVRTRRLEIAPLQASDAFQLVFLTNDPLVAGGLSLLRQPFTLSDAQDLIALSRLDKGCFASVRLGEGGVFIGCAGALVRDEKDVEIGFWLGAPYHGKQYGAEAAEAMLEQLRAALPDRRIVAECPRENSASWRLLKKLGFAPCGAVGWRKGAQLLAYEASQTVC